MDTGAEEHDYNAPENQPAGVELAAPTSPNEAGLAAAKAQRVKVAPAESGTKPSRLRSGSRFARPAGSGTKPSRLPSGSKFKLARSQTSNSKAIDRGLSTMGSRSEGGEYMDPAEEARVLFEATDIDKSGTITKDEFGKLCKMVSDHAVERNEHDHQLREEVRARVPHFRSARPSNASVCPPSRTQVKTHKRDKRRLRYAFVAVTVVLVVSVLMNFGTMLYAMEISKETSVECSCAYMSSPGLAWLVLGQDGLCWGEWALRGQAKSLADQPKPSFS